MYIDIVTVADVPDDYDTRLVAMDIEGLRRLWLKVFERHDLVLAKLCRNIDRDREDVVARGPGLDIDGEKISPCGSGLRSSKRAEKGDRPEHDVLTSEPPDPYHLFLLPKDVRSLRVEDR